MALTTMQYVKRLYAEFCSHLFKQDTHLFKQDIFSALANEECLLRLAHQMGACLETLQGKSHGNRQPATHGPCRRTLLK